MVCLMDILFPLKVAWRSTFQKKYEKHAAYYRRVRRSKRFSRRDNSIDPIVIEILRRLTPSVAPPMKLVGGSSDGGYLVPDIPISNMVLFSAGVGHVVDFEFEFAERGHKVILADGTVSDLPRSHSNFRFEARNIGLAKGEIALGAWISLHLQPTEVAAIQMDIEGAEWDALSSSSISDELLSGVEWLVVEFHGLERIWSDRFRSSMIGVIDRLLEFFIPVAAHANNCGHRLKVGDYELPSVFEVTFFNRGGQSLAAPGNVVFPNFSNCPDRRTLQWPNVAN